MSGEADRPPPSSNSVHVPCGHMDQHRQNDWACVRYDARFDEYWVPSGGQQQCLFFCPWCGEKLPDSKRGLWFDELEAVGIDPISDVIPSKYQSGEWRGESNAVAHAVPRRGGPVAGRVLDGFPSDDFREATS